MQKNIITVSREYGSGGYEIGEKVAAALGFQFYDKKLIADLADQLMMPQSFIEAADEKIPRRNIFHELAPIFVTDANDDADYIFRQQGEFIVKLASKGSCVIAGRRADYYLRDNPAAMHLFFYADEDFKIERISRTENCTPEEAAKKIADMDKRRKTSYEYTTGRKWADRHNYDRMICTSTYGIDRTVEELVRLIQG